MKKLVLILSLFAGSFSFAEYSSIGLSTQGSASSSSATNTLSYGHGEDRKEDKIHDDEYVWGMTFDYSNTKSPTTTTDQSGNSISVNLLTNEFAFDSYWESLDHLTLGGGFAYTSQTGENVAPVLGLNPTFTIEKAFRYNEPNKKSQKKTTQDSSNDEDEDDDIFVPSVKLKLKLGNNIIGQSVGRKRLGPSGGGSGQNSFSMTQKLVETGIDWNAIKLLTVGTTSKKYSYSKDVNEVLALMDGGRATGPAVALQSSLSSFLDSEVTVFMTFHLFSDYDLDFSKSVSKAATDYSTTDDKAVTLTYYGQTWTLGMSGGQSLSSTDGSNSSYWTASIKYNY